MSLSTTQRYMHLAHGAPREGIRALEAGIDGGGVEADVQPAEKVRNDA